MSPQSICGIKESLNGAVRGLFLEHSVFFEYDFTIEYRVSEVVQPL
jgi:hypothetical protein